MGPWKTHFRQRADRYASQEIPALAFLSKFYRAVANLEWAGVIRNDLDLLRPALAGRDLAELVWIEGALVRDVKPIEEARDYAAVSALRSIGAFVREYFAEEEERQKESDPLGHIEKMERKGDEIRAQVERWRASLQ